MPTLSSYAIRNKVITNTTQGDRHPRPRRHELGSNIVLDCVASLRRATWSTHARISRSWARTSQLVERTNQPRSPLAEPTPTWLNTRDEPGLNHGLGRRQRLSRTWPTCKHPAAHVSRFLGHWLNPSPTCTAYHAHQHLTPISRVWTCPTSARLLGRISRPCLGHAGAKFRKTRTLVRDSLARPPKPYARLPAHACACLPKPAHACLSLSRAPTPCRNHACPRTTRTRLHQPRPPALASPRLCRGLALLNPRRSARRPYATLRGSDKPTPAG